MPFWFTDCIFREILQKCQILVSNKINKCRESVATCTEIQMTLCSLKLTKSITSSFYFQKNVPKIVTANSHNALGIKKGNCFNQYETFKYELNELLVSIRIRTIAIALAAHFFKNKTKSMKTITREISFKPTYL